MDKNKIEPITLEGTILEAMEGGFTIMIKPFDPFRTQIITYHEEQKEIYEQHLPTDGHIKSRLRDAIKYCMDKVNEKIIEKHK